MWVNTALIGIGALLMSAWLTGVVRRLALSHGMRPTQGTFARALRRERLTSSLQVDIDPAIAELNWRPGISVDQELARTVASFEMEQKCME
jgi:nucleoside-diphosphate-sugar epimerase